MDVSKVHRYVFAGRKDLHWYSECSSVFIDLFGEDKLKLVCNLFAATSINTSLKSNITLFRKAYYEWENGLPVGNYLPNIVNQLQRLREGKELSGRKIRSFAAAMSGDRDAVVVDIWLLRAFDLDRKHMRHSGPHAGLMRSGGPTDAQYTRIEGWIRDEAYAMGVEPRQLSAMIWSGTRIMTNGDTETHYKDRLQNSLTNFFNVI